MAAASLSACAQTGIGSVTGGECKLTPVAEYEVLGKTNYDQRWIDETTEALIAGCNRPRPKARPAELDKPNRVITPVIKQAPPAKPIKRWWQRTPKVAAVAAGFVIPRPRPVAAPERPVEPPAVVEVVRESPAPEIVPAPAEARRTEPLDDLLAPRAAPEPAAKRNSCWLWLC